MESKEEICYAHGAIKLGGKILLNFWVWIQELVSVDRPVHGWGVVDCDLTVSHYAGELDCQRFKDMIFGWGTKILTFLYPTQSFTGWAFQFRLFSSMVVKVLNSLWVVEQEMLSTRWLTWPKLQHQSLQHMYFRLEVMGPDIHCWIHIYTLPLQLPSMFSM